MIMTLGETGDAAMTAAKELDAMKRIVAILDEFEDGEAEARARVVQWIAGLYGGPGTGNAPPAGIPAAPHAQQPNEDDGVLDLADLFDAAGPQTDADRALVVGYWLTESEGKSDFTSQEVHSQLKNFGYPVANITSVFTGLMKRKPALAMQTAKSGTSRQARKRYKLTRAGHDAVGRKLLGERESED